MRRLTGGLARPFGVRNAASGHHPVHGTRQDHLVGAEAVAVLEFATVEIGDRGEADVGMRAHVNALAGHELGRARLVEEDEGADHLPLGCRQCAAHFEAAEVTCTRDDQRLNGIDTDGVRAARLEGWIPAHGCSPVGSDIVCGNERVERRRV